MPEGTYKLFKLKVALWIEEYNDILELFEDGDNPAKELLNELVEEEKEILELYLQITVEYDDWKTKYPDLSSSRKDLFRKKSNLIKKYAAAEAEKGTSSVQN